MVTKEIHLRLLNSCLVSCLIPRVSCLQWKAILLHNEPFWTISFFNKVCRVCRSVYFKVNRQHLDCDLAAFQCQLNYACLGNSTFQGKMACSYSSASHLPSFGLARHHWINEHLPWWPMEASIALLVLCEEINLISLLSKQSLLWADRSWLHLMQTKIRVFSQPTGKGTFNKCFAAVCSMAVSAAPDFGDNLCQKTKRIFCCCCTNYFQVVARIWLNQIHEIQVLLPPKHQEINTGPLSFPLLPL